MKYIKWALWIAAIVVVVFVARAVYYYFAKETVTTTFVDAAKVKADAVAEYLRAHPAQTVAPATTATVAPAPAPVQQQVAAPAQVSTADLASTPAPLIKPGDVLKMIYWYGASEMSTVPANIPAVLVMPEGKTAPKDALVGLKDVSTGNWNLRSPKPRDIVYMDGLGGTAQLVQQADGHWRWIAKQIGETK